MKYKPDGEFLPEHLSTLPHQTPYFVFSKKRIKDSYASFKTYFPGASIHFAMKANSELPILELLKDEGAGFEVASKYELDMLKKLNVKPEKILYGTSVKPTSHIKEFYDYGVRMYAFDSIPELEKIAEHAPQSKVIIRLVVNDAGSVFNFSEKFGTTKNNLVPYLVKAKELGLRPYGISFHVGSQASNPRAWSEALEIIAVAMKELQENNIELDVINLGGGFPCQYESSSIVPTLEEIANHTYTTYNKMPYQPALILEPGRGLVAHTGVTVATVIGRIERPQSAWLFLDAGVYNAFFEAMAYQGSTRYPISSMRTSFDSGEMIFAVSGPSGDSPDILTREALLPKDIAVGDKVIIHNTGAYSLVCTSPFNGFPKPDVFYI